MYTCPVCGYDRLRRPPEDYLICPSCGTEFGYSDSTRTYRALRQDWLNSGALWYSQATPQPLRWNAYQQLRRAGFLEVRPKTSNDESTVNIVNFGATQAEVGAGVTIYGRFIPIGAAGADLLGRVHYATA